VKLSLSSVLMAGYY